MNVFEPQLFGSKATENKEEQPETLQEPRSDVSVAQDGAVGNLQEEIVTMRQRDDARIAQIMDSLGGEQSGRKKDIQQYLGEYLILEGEALEKVGLLRAKDLPKQYQSQLDSLHDERLDSVTFAVVPDDIWKKGKQPSESDAERQLVLIRQSYFEAQEKPDDIAWISHELAHCQNLLDSESGAVYQANMQKFAFEDLKTAYPYPNNPVEQFAFTKQFQYLKGQGRTREEIMTMLGQYYGEEDTPFFNRVLDGVYTETNQKKYTNYSIGTI